MKRSLRLIFDTSDTHKLGNFTEELSMSLGDLGTLPMEQADTAIDTVVVTNIPRREFHRCRKLIEKLLKKHFLDEVCEIVEEGRK